MDLSSDGGTAETFSSSLLAACEIGYSGEVKALLKKGAEVDFQDSSGMSALMYASREGKCEVVKILLGKGAKVDLLDSGGWSALMYASIRGQERVMKVLVSNGANVNRKTKSGWSALMYAAREGEYASTRWLLENNADINQQNECLLTALMIASQRGHYRVAQLFNQNKAKLDLQDSKGLSALMYAVKGYDCRSSLTSVLWTDGNGEHNVEDSKGQFHSMYASSKSEQVAIAKILIQHGANLELQDSDGKSSLMHAIISGCKEVAKLLIQKGILLDQQDSNRCSALIHAIQQGQCEMAILLICKGVQLNLCDQRNRTALIYACLKRKTNVVYQLVMEGANIFIKDMFGYTALTYLLHAGENELARFLTKRILKKDVIYENLVSDDENMVLKVFKMQSVLLHSFNTPIHYGVIGMILKDLSVEKCLRIAVNFNLWCLVRWLCLTASQLDIQDEQGLTPLMCVSKEGIKDIVKIMIEKGTNVNLQDKDGLSALAHAASSGNYATAKLLVENGAHLNTQDENGLSILMHAISRLNLSQVTVQNSQATLLERNQIIKLLLEKSAMVNFVCNKGWSTLVYSIRLGDRVTIEMLLNYGAQLNFQDGEGVSCLMHAVECQHSEVIQLMLERGAKIDLVDNSGCTALVYALRHQSEKAIKLLKKWGAELNKHDFSNKSYLMYALEYGNDKVARLMIEAESDLNLQDDDGWSALMYAINYDQAEVAMLLLQKGINIDLVDRGGLSSLMYASINNQYEVAKVMLIKKCQVNLQDIMGLSALTHAIINESEVTTLLLVKGAQLDQIDQNGKTSLMHALEHNQPKLAMHLLEVDPMLIDERDIVGKSTLIYAVLNGQDQVVKELLKKQIDLDVQDDSGSTALIHACSGRQIEVAIDLLRNGAALQLQDNLGWSALMYAARNSMGEVIREISCDMDIQDIINHQSMCDGVSALMIAVQSGDYNMVKLLVDYNANLDLCNWAAWSAFKYAIHFQQHEIMKLLYKRGAQQIILGKPSLVHTVECNLWKEAMVILEMSQEVTLLDDDIIFILRSAGINSQMPFVKYLCKKWSPIHHDVLVALTRSGQIEVVKILQENGVDIDEQDFSGKTCLMQALESGNLEIAECFLSMGANYGIVDNEGRSSLLYALRYGCNSVARLLIEKDVALVYVQDSIGQSPLTYAIKFAREVVQLLLENGAPVKVQDKLGTSPLMLAIQERAYELVEQLIQMGDTLDLQNSEGISALMYAVSQKPCKQDGELIYVNDAYLYEDPCSPNDDSASEITISCKEWDIISLMLNHGAQVNLQDNLKKSALVYAIFAGNYEIAGFLVEKGANINLLVDEKSLIYYVLLSKQWKLAELLLGKGACAMDCGIHLMSAVLEGKIEILQMLLFNCDECNHLQDKNGRSLLMTALVKEEKEAAMLLLEYGAEVDHQDIDGKTSLMYAARMNDCEIIKALLAIKPNLNIRDKNGMSSLAHLVLKSEDDAVGLLVDAGANLNVQDSKGQTPLFYACQMGKSNLAELLVCNGALLNMQDVFGCTPLMYSIIHGKDYELTKMLLEVGALQIDIQDYSGRSALIYAVQNKLLEIVQLLLDKGSQVNVSDHKGSSVLKYALDHGQYEMVQLLLKNGAEQVILGKPSILYALNYGKWDEMELMLKMSDHINLNEEDAISALVCISQHKNLKLLELLVQSGVQIDTLDSNGLSALVHAIKMKHAEAVAILLSLHASPNLQSEFKRTCLMHAIESLELVKLLLGAGARLDLQDADGKTALMHAILYNKSDVVETYLIRDGFHLDWQDCNGKSALMHAIEKSKTELAKELIRKGSFLDLVDDNGRSAFIYSIMVDASELAFYLVEMGAQVDHQDKKGLTALMHAVRSNIDELAELLVSKGAQLNLQDKKGRSALMHSVKKWNNEFAEMLIGMGVQLDLKSRNGKSALMYAAAHRNWRVVKLLAEQGAQLDIQDEFGQSILLHAVEKRKHDVAKLLIEKGAALDMQDWLGNSALIIATEDNNKEIVTLLIEKGCSLDLQDILGFSALMHAVRNGAVDSCTILVNNGAQLNLQDYKDRSALHHSVKMGSIEITKLLLEGGAEVDIQNHNKKSALLCAIIEGNLKVAELLVNSGASVNIQDSNGMSALMYIVEEAECEMLAELLIIKGSQLDLQDNDDMSALMHSIAWGEFEIVKQLTEKRGIQLNLQDIRGKSALMHAIDELQYDMAKLLVAAQAQLDLQDVSGKSALMYAIDKQEFEYVNLLIETGAQLNLQNIDGRSALMCALDMQDYEIAKLIIDKGAQLDLQDVNGKCALMQAMSLQMAQLLLESGAKLDLHDNYGKSALMNLLTDGSSCKEKFDIIQLLVEKGTWLDQQDCGGYSALMHAILAEDTDTCMVILSRGDLEVNLQDKSGKSALIHSVEHKLFDVVDKLVKMNATLDLCDNWGNTALKYALSTREYGIAKLLLNKGAYQDCSIGEYLIDAFIQDQWKGIDLLIGKDNGINFQNADGTSALMSASKLCNLDVAQLLLENGAIVDLQDSNGRSALRYAVKHWHQKIVELLIRHGAGVNLKDGDGVTALMSACSQGNTETVEHLLEHGAIVNLEDKYQKTAIIYSSQEGKCGVTKLLFQGGAQVNKQDQTGCSALFHATMQGHIEVIEFLIDKGASMDLQDFNGWSPLMVAIHAERLELAHLMIDKGCQVNLQNEQGWSALIISSMKGMSEVAEKLIDKGADLNLQCSEGMTALMYACKFGREMLGMVILDKGADVSLKNSNNWSALMIALHYGQCSLAKILLQRNTFLDFEGSDLAKLSLLHAIKLGQDELISAILESDVFQIGTEDSNLVLALAIQWDKVGIIQLLLNRGIRPNFSSNSALIHAIFKGQWSLAESFLENDATLADLQDDKGVSVLMHAINYMQDTNVVTKLLEMCSHLDQQDYDGLTALMYATKGGHTTIVNSLVKQGAGLNLQNKDGLIALMHALQSNNPSIILPLLNIQSDVDIKDNKGRTSLMYAIRRGYYNYASKLLLKGAKPDQQDNDGVSCLMHACKHPNLQIATLLVEKGAQLNLQDKKGLAALQHAILTKDYYLACLLIHCGSDVNQSDEKGLTPLMYSIKVKEVGIARLLIEKGALLDLVDQEGRSALMYACKYGTYRIAEKLIDTSSQLNLQCSNGMSGLMYAIEHKMHSIVLLLLDNNADVDLQNVKGISILMSSIASSMCIKKLLRRTKDVDLQDFKGRTALMYLLQSDTFDFEDAALLISKSRNIDLQDELGASALMYAIQNNKTEVCTILLEKGSQANLQNIVGQTPLMCACLKDDIKVARLLLESSAQLELQDYEGSSALMYTRNCNFIGALLFLCGANINHQNVYGHSALMYFTTKDNYRLMCGLLQTARANPNLLDNTGASALIYAIQNDDIKTVRLLIKHGACVNSRTYTGESPLFIACANDYESILELLLQSGALIDMQDTKGRSALTIASIEGHIDTVNRLTKRGANVNLQDDNGWSSLMYACYEGHADIVQLLLATGASLDVKSSSQETAWSVMAQYHPELINILEFKHEKCVVQLSMAAKDEKSTCEEREDNRCLKNIDSLLLNSFWSKCSDTEEDSITDVSSISANSVRTHYRLVPNQELYYEMNEDHAVYYEVVKLRKVRHEVVVSDEIYYYQVTKRDELIYYEVSTAKNYEQSSDLLKTEKIGYEIVKNKGLQVPENLPSPPKVPTWSPSLSSIKPTKDISFYHTGMTHLQRYSWFHGYINRDEANDLLLHARNGTFLVRENLEKYSLSFCNKGRVLHYHIHGDKEKPGIFLSPKRKFESLPELIRHYTYSDELPIQHPLERIGRPKLPQVYEYKATVEADEWELNRSDFSVSDRIGGGQFGDVFKAILKSSGELVAVKTFKDTQKNPKNFLEEMEVMKHIKHPNIVSLLGMCTQELPLYLVIEFMPHGNLLEYVRKKRAQIEVVLLVYYSQQVAKAMLYLESMRIVHGDLALRNCLMGELNLVKLSDFGLSKILKEDSEVFVPMDKVKVPIKWAAPQVLSDHKLSLKSDIWSFGVVLWELATFGRTPYPTMLNKDVYSYLESGNRMQCPDGYPKPYVDLMKQCWEWHPEDRPTFSQVSQIINSMAKINEAIQDELSIEMSRNIESECTGISFLGEPKVVTLTSAKELNDIGISLFTEEPQIDIKLAICPCLTGPFILPEKYMPVSPAYLIKTASELSGAIKMHVQHCIDLKTEEDCSRIKFFFATTTPTYDETKPFYKFKRLTGNFSIGSQIGVVITKNTGLFIVATQHFYGNCLLSLRLLHTIQEKNRFEAIFYCHLTHPVYKKHADEMVATHIGLDELDKEPMTTLAKITSDKITLNVEPNVEWDMRLDKKSDIQVDDILFERNFLPKVTVSGQRLTYSEAVSLKLSIHGLHEECIFQLHEVDLSALQEDDVESEDFIKAIEEAIAKSGMINRKLAHLMFVGPPGSGKSSLIHRLLGRLCEIFLKSTGVCNPVIMVDVAEANPASIHSATIMDSNKWEEIDYELSLIKQMGQENIVYSDEPSKTMEENREKLDGNYSQLKEESSISPAMKKPTPRPRTKLPKKSSTKKLVPSQSSIPSKESPVVIAVPRKSIQFFIRKYGYSTFKNYLKRTCSLYLRDTGGQVEFQEMLPLLIFGPSIVFFVFRADLDFTKKFTVGYRVSSTSIINSYTSSITTEEALLQCLASVFAMDTSEEIKTHKPLVFIIGTHIDNLGPSASSKLEDLNSCIERLVVKNGFQHLVEYADEKNNQIMFAVDNTSENESAFELIRSKVNFLVNCRTEFAFEYPVSYLLFCLDLQNVKVNILTLNEFKLLAKEHGIEESQVIHLLRFLHLRVGIIRYYDVDGLRNFVVIQPQVLFNTITQLVIKTFSSKALTSSERRQFKEEGLLAASTFENVVAESEASKGILPVSAIKDAIHGNDNISPQKFLQLLVHLRIITPFITEKGEEEKYFIPCVLNHVSESHDSNEDFDILPLAVKFCCDHCPKGLFGVVVTHFMKPDYAKEFERKITFSLIKEKIYKDQVSFVATIAGFSDEISLKACHSHLELAFSPDLSDDREFPVETVCNDIRLVFRQFLLQALKDLHYSVKKTEPIMCLRCNSCSELHPVIEGGKFNRLYCPYKHRNYRLPPEGMCWYNEGKQKAPLSSVRSEASTTVSAVSQATLTIAHLSTVKKYLTNLANDELVNMGIELGLHYPHIRNLSEMRSFRNDLLTAWLIKEDSVMEVSGEPSWATLITALKAIGQHGIAQNISKDH